MRAREKALLPERLAYVLIRMSINRCILRHVSIGNPRPSDDSDELELDILVSQRRFA